ncbi:transposase [Streptomyces sp. NBC_01716]|uniref:transposase n=1 Tax=Streptomyces sp. NBC_01716 TaxID=2975917 RepID=UPI003FCDF0D2
MGREQQDPELSDGQGGFLVKLPLVQTKRYTEEFKRDAIALVDSTGKTVTAVARELGISSGPGHPRGGRLCHGRPPPRRTRRASTGTRVTARSFGPLPARGGAVVVVLDSRHCGE